MPKKHQIVAILFADVVGYTALMQNNEQQALVKLDKFKITLEKQVPLHRGEIVQFYGDGCLVTFKSSIDAVACALKLQKGFKEGTKVPTRIGLHLGEVVFKVKNLFRMSI